MLNEEVAKYRELSGDTNPNTPISRIGGYLDGYEKALEQEPCEDAIGREDMLDAIGHGTTYTSEELQRIIKGLPPVNPQKCDRCEVGNPCLYCKHEFEPQESERV